ncbi:MAG: tetratricopeptide repeat protein, partial [Alphaproteobacteria bacterium]|nr:tetratricopeptide repeat protein [Alphaproteobacteria bacterium]
MNPAQRRPPTGQQRTGTRAAPGAIPAAAQPLLAGAARALREGRLTEAEALCRKALEGSPEQAETLHLMGVISCQAGDHEAALAHFAKALGSRPDFAAAHYDLGNAFRSLGRQSEAVASYRRAIELEPKHLPAHNNLGNALRALGRLEEALASLQRAVALDPRSPEVRNNLGNVLLGLGRLGQAADMYRAALALRPDYVEAHNNLGNVLAKLGRPEDAVDNYLRALDLDPNHAHAHNNLGAALEVLKRYDEALASCRRALELNPDYGDARNNLGNVLRDLGRHDEAMASYREALALQPDNAEVQSNLIYLLRMMPDTTSAQLREEADRFGAMVTAGVRPFTAWKGRRDAAKRLRVGFVSGDFCNHVVGRYLAAFLGHVDPSQMELAAYSAVIKEDDHTARLKRHFALWRPVVGLDDAALARLIHDDAIDILVDLSGHTGLNRLPMFAYKPAPVQATWLGLFATSGVPGMDYIIAAPGMVAEGEAEHFTEEVWPLAESWFCLSVPGTTPEPGPLPALANGAVTFGCFNNLTKLTDAVIALWARVLEAVPGARLFLKAGQLGAPAVRGETLARFAAHGIGEERLILEGRSPLAAYFAAYRRVDIALDPFPFHGATTTLDGLW